MLCLSSGPALKSATNLPGLRQLQCLTSIVLPLSIIIAVLPFSLPLQLCPETLSEPRACPQECNQYPEAETTPLPYFNSITSKHYNSSVTFHLTITTSLLYLNSITSKHYNNNITFFFNDTAITEIYTRSLRLAFPI